eukprot:6222770-Ditylum_brightwellii.AAC.1
MKNGTFISAHPAIVWITYIEERKDGIDRGPSESDSAEVEIEMARTDSHIYSFVIAGVLGVFFASLLGAWRHMKNRRKNSEGDEVLGSGVSSEPDESYLNDFSSYSSNSELDTEKGEVDSSDFNIDNISSISIQS